METTRKSPAGQAGQILNNLQNKGNQKPLTIQDIRSLSRFQRGKLIIALNEAKQPLNMRQLSIITGIERPTMCRRISELQEMGLAEIVRYGICPISKHPRVGFYAKKRI